jgi:membrane-bound metal-dependent hydrolase YbcI (DUF457 family)
MRREAHLAITFIVSVFVVWLGFKFGLLRSLFASILLVLIALFSTELPDVLEPGKQINHRKFFHSRKMLNLLSLGLLVSLLLILLGNVKYFYALFFFLGYWLHLAADSLTSRLPR